MAPNLRLDPWDCGILLPLCSRMRSVGEERGSDLHRNGNWKASRSLPKPSKNPCTIQSTNDTRLVLALCANMKRSGASPDAPSTVSSFSHAFHDFSRLGQERNGDKDRIGYFANPHN